MGSKRIYLGRENSKYATIAGGAIVTITALFFVLMAVGLEITGSDDFCLGTPESPCVSYGKICNLGPDNYDIYNPEGFKMDFSPTIENYWIFFKDGRVKKEFLIPQGIEHSTKGWRYENFTDATKPRKDRIYVHRFARYSCQDYMLVGLKENPDDLIKWGVGVGKEYLDPFWYGINDTANISTGASMNVELGSPINISANITGAATVCVDIDHPDYGINYTCGTPNANFIFEIDYFQKNTFNDSTTSKLFSFDTVVDSAYAEGGVWEGGHDYVLAHDGDWGTYAQPSIAFGSSTYFANYSIPTNVDTSDVTWLVKDEVTTQHIVISEQCIDPYSDDTLVFKVELDNVDGATASIEYYCYNTTGDWNLLEETFPVWDTAYLFETQINWDVSPEWPSYTDYFGFEVNAFDDVLNISMNLTGADVDGTMPANIRLKINGTLSNTIPLLMNGYDNLQNITGTSGGAWTSLYYPISTSCQGGFYSSVPCTRMFDDDVSTYGQSNAAGNVTYVFKKSESGTTATEFFFKTGIGTVQVYCQEDGGGWKSMGSSSSYSTNELLIADTCNNASVDNITIRGRLTTSDMVFEGWVRWKTDGSNTSFNLDGETTTIATLRLPSKGTMDTAIFNVSGSYSEDFTDITTATDSTNGYIISGSLEGSQEFIPTKENLTAVWVFLSDYDTTELTIKVGTTAGGSELSSDAFAVGAYSNVGTWAKFDLTDSVLTPGVAHFISLDSAGDSIAWSVDNTNPYPDGSAYVNGGNITSSDFLLKTVMFDLATDPKITIGDLDTNYEWNATGNYSGNTQSVDLSANITEYLLDCSPESDGYCLVPFYFLSSTPGKLRVHAITMNHTYNPNPVYLDSTVLADYLSEITSTGNVQIPITLITGSAGNITIDDVRIDYAGGNDTIEVLVWESTNKSNNESLSLINYFSKWDYEFPSFIEWLEFIPKGPTEKNVTPYGQSALRPILNITSYGYGGMVSNFSVYLNETHSCVNLTMSTTDNKSAGFVLNATWKDYFTDFDLLDSQGLWMWADYGCNYTTWKLWEPTFSFRNCCEECICSEELE